jgi:hypothetical protein
MINITLGKNKVFLLQSLALHHFNFILLLEEGRLGGSRVAQRTEPVVDVFREGGNTYNNHFYQAGRLLPSFFYILSQHFFAITISWLLSSILKLAVRLCCFYYPFGQVFGPGGLHTRITL